MENLEFGPLMRLLFLLLFLIHHPCPARPLKTLRELDGIKFSKVQYLAPEKNRDTVLEAAIVRACRLPSRFPVQYLHNYVSMAGNRKFVLALMVSSSFASDEGYHMLLFEIVSGDYRFISDLLSINNPVLICKTTTNNWKDVVFLTGKGMAAQHYVTIKFNGKEYPVDTYISPKVKAGSILTGTAVFGEEIHSDTGHSFKAQ